MKEAKSKSISKSKSGDAGLNFISTKQYHHEAFELALIITPMGLLQVDFLT